MIQRIQSIYLVLSGVLLISFLFLPLVEISDESSVYSVKATGLYNLDGLKIMPLYLITTIAIISSISSFLLIFGYKNRKKQMQFCLYHLVLHILLIGIVGYDIYSLWINYGAIVSHKLSLLIPIISIILIWFARASIKKDDELVRSMDRLR